MARLTAASRRNIPKSEMGLPGKAKKGRGAVTGSYPMPDRKHAAVAKGYAKRFASPSERKVIDAKANKILRRGK
jgi:hypothetical protein